MREKVVTELRDSTGRRPHYRYTTSTTHTHTPLCTTANTLLLTPNVRQWDLCGCLGEF